MSRELGFEQKRQRQRSHFFSESEAPPDREEEVTAADLDALLRQALNRLSVKDAVAEIAAVSGMPRREVYRRAIELSKERGHAR